LSVVFGDPEQKWIKFQNDFDYGIAKINMAQKIQEIFSQKNKNKEHEVFQDF